MPSVRHDAVQHSMPAHDMQPLWSRIRLRQIPGMTKLTYGCQQSKMHHCPSFHLTLNTTDIYNYV